MNPSETPLRDTERRNPRSAELDLLSPAELVALFVEEDSLVAAAVARAAPSITAVLELLERTMRRGGRLFYVGAGTSGRLGVLDAAECPPTFGTSAELVQGVIAGGEAALTAAVEGAEDNIQGAVDELNRRGFSAADFLLGIAASGTTPFVRGALLHGNRLGASTGLLTCTGPDAELVRICGVVIHLEVGPELLTGSTRLKAGTATKMVLNTLTTGVMARLGKTWGNLMVDLQATNLKLRERGERMVMLVAEVGRDEARRALDAADQKVRTAIVMARRKVTREEAERLLARADYRLRTVIGPPPGESND